MACIWYRSAFQPLHIRGVSWGHNSLGAESLWGRQITAGGAEKSQQCQKYFLLYSAFTSERLQVRTLGAKLACYQWGADVWWCPGRLPNCMPPSQILVLSCGVCWFC